MKTLTKFSFNPKDGKVLARWTEPSAEGGRDQYELTSTDPPHPDLVDALEALAPVVAEACELRDTNGRVYADQLAVRGLTLKDTLDADGGDAEGVTITALRELPWSNAPLVLNTPFAPLDSLPHPRAERLVQAVAAEAVAYVNGKRLQADLFAGDGTGRSVTFGRGAQA